VQSKCWKCQCSPSADNHTMSFGQPRCYMVCCPVLSRIMPLCLQAAIQPHAITGTLTATDMLLYSLLALSRLCCMTALASTVVPSGSLAIWCGCRLDANVSTSCL